jgi:carbonic anhydrase
MSADWGYNEENGPQIWPQKFSIASSGKRQSPIDINTSNCLVKSGEELNIVYPQSFPSLSILNSGHGWKVDIPDDLAQNTSLTGGPLQNKYRLAQFHCHWGRDCSVGSEHTVDGKSYAAELHFVHWNTDLFSSAADAMPATDGLAVLGVFLELGPTPNEELEKLLHTICSIKFKGEKCQISEPVDVTKLLPENKSYWTYPGSLTTPPLWESVTWIVFSNPIKCTADQIARFRDLYYCSKDNSLTGGQLLENYRMPQPLNDRTVTFVSV